MSTMLFDHIVYGPVHSRRLGVSLGVNLLPADGKRCTFNCIYCECGFNQERKTHQSFPAREAVQKALVDKLALLNEKGISPDRITFSGNGEPTMHPQFAEIIDDTLEIRDTLCPSAKVAVLSSSTMLHKTDVLKALCKIDENLMKLDSATERLFKLIDQPVIHYLTADKVIKQLCRFDGKLTIQTIFLRGEYQGEWIDNTQEREVDLWIEALKKIKPRAVMIYTINRETPVTTIQKIPVESLEAIAAKVRAAGFQVQVAG